MLEIGAWHPSWGDVHLGPANALTALELLGGGTLLPVHWSTFNLGMHAWDEPAETLFELARRAGTRIVTPVLGEATEPGVQVQPVAWYCMKHVPSRARESMFGVRA